MPGIPKAKLGLLKEALIKDAMSPAEAARKAGVTYATASRYYEKWSNEIKVSREQQLIPQFEASIKKLGKAPKRKKGR